MKSQPNILFLFTDQQRADTLGCYGNPVCQTPHIDSLAARGVRFDRAYTPTSICTPARASLLTGLMPHKHKLLANFERNVGYLTELPADLEPFSARLRAAGYNVGTVGKWHIGEELGPSHYGFDGEHYPGWGPPTQHPAYLRYLEERELPGFAVRDVIRGRFPNGNPANVLAGIYDGPVEGLFDAFITEEAVRTLRTYANDDKPFFLACQWFGPHLPYLVPADAWNRYPVDTIPLPESMAESFENKPQVQRNYALHWAWDTLSSEEQRQVIAAYWAYVSIIDAQVGCVLAALHDSGLEEETIVVFSSDHGAFAGAHRLEDKGPAMYEDTYRVPLIVRLPGGRAGAVDDRFVSLVDLTATFVDAAGMAVPPEYDGRSLLPLLQGEDPSFPWRDHVIAEFHGHHFPYPQRMIRTERYKLVINPADMDELYDLVEDPLELTNQVGNPDFAVVRAALSQRLYRELRASGDNFYHWMSSMHPIDGMVADASLSSYRVFDGAR